MYGQNSNKSSKSTSAAGKKPTGKKSSRGSGVMMSGGKKLQTTNGMSAPKGSTWPWNKA